MVRGFRGACLLGEGRLGEACEEVGERGEDGGEVSCWRVKRVGLGSEGGLVVFGAAVGRERVLRGRGAG